MSNGATAIQSETPASSDLQLTAGRCSTCQHIRSFDLPLRTIYFCRALRGEMTPEEKDLVRSCSSWAGFRPVSVKERRRLADQGAVPDDLLSLEGRLFAALRVRLDRLGIDLATLMLIAYPSLTSVEQIRWLNDLPTDKETDISLTEITDHLTQLRYEPLADLLRPLASRGLAPVIGRP